MVESVETMSKIKWGKFTDNFMYLVPGYGLGALDWFDEKAWADDGYILTNVRAIARMGQAGGCKGILFDPDSEADGAGGDQGVTAETKERLIELLQEKRSALISHAVTKGLDTNAPMKDSGIEWLGEVPEHWNVWLMKRIAEAKIITNDCCSAADMLFQ